jgi:hypothetical protein
MAENHCKSETRGENYITIHENYFQTEILKKFSTETLEPFLNRLSNTLKTNGTGYLVGDKVSIV